MGIGSFFASLFQKDETSQKEIRELNVEKQSKELTSAKKERKQEKDLPVQEKAVSDKVSKASAKNRKTEAVSETGTVKEEPAKLEIDPEKAAKKEYFQAKKELYYFLNQTMKTLYEADQSDSWKELPGLERPSEKAVSCLEGVREELPENLWDLLRPFTEEDRLAAPSDLKDAYLAMLLPFYPAYRSELEEFKYNTLLNRDALELFRRLTGRKYRLGYRNRYSTGVTAFEWKGEQYKVYNKKGVLLCDATFDQGAVKNGYAVQIEESQEDSDWDILKKGSFRDGKFTEGALEYLYKKPVGVL